ncbi:beta-lactamase family protein [Pseudoclavibacter terrae]|uniref:Beta-lactamase family protein n=1 Tax=Pseudoclavibacter terrae TaxID=1530195 RepID=A0A7J5B0K4_9MICO|nr:beta-lactamase family protein [Pseudoclavibacter terrae]
MYSVEGSKLLSSPLFLVRGLSAIALTWVFAMLGATSAAAAPVGLTSTAHELTTEDVNAWLDGMLPSALEREGIAGATVGVVSKGQVMTQRGFGYADTGSDTEDPVPVDPQHTLFRIGSISKIVTATAVMQLVEQGRLALDAPVQDYLDFTLDTSFEKPITLRHLLTHTAGFEDKIAGVIAGPGENATSLRDAVTVDQPEQIAEPGTTPAYSNYSNGLAAYVVERTVGVGYADYVQEHVFDAVGMSTATLAQPLPDEMQLSMSKGYSFTGSAEVPFEINAPAPAGAISATTADMNAFMLAQLGDSSPLLSERTLEQMHEPALSAEELGGLAAGPRMTLGYFEADRNGHRILSHGGDLTAFHAQLDLYPDDEAGVYISLNSTGLNGDASTAIRDALSRGFADRYFPDQRDAAVVETTTAAEHADEIVGTYQVSRRSESTFVRLFAAFSTVEVSPSAGNAVTISAVTDLAGIPVDLVEVEPWVWQEVDGQRRFAVDQQDGRVVAIGLNPAFALQPMSPSRAALPIIATLSLAVLAAAVLALPARWGIRRWYKVAQEAPRRERLLRRLRAVALVALALAGILWATVAATLLSDGAPPSAVILRSAQALTFAAVLGALPALLLAIHRAQPTENNAEIPSSWRSRGAHTLRITGRIVLTLAFCGLGYVAVVGGLLLPSITY